MSGPLNFLNILPKSENISSLATTSISASSPSPSSSSSIKVEENVYSCCYLGTTLLTDATDRQSLKMSARAVLADDARVEAEALLVDLQLAEKELSMVRHEQQTTVFSVRYSHVGACFILRENPRIVTLAVTEKSPPGSFGTYGHILFMITPDDANSLVAAVLEKFSPRVIQATPARGVSVSTSTAVEASSSLLFFGSDYPGSVEGAAPASNVMVIPPSSSASAVSTPTKMMRPAPPLPPTYAQSVAQSAQSAAQSQLCLLDF